MKIMNFTVPGSNVNVKSIDVAGDPNKKLIIVQCPKTDLKIKTITDEAFTQFGDQQSKKTRNHTEQRRENHFVSHRER